MVLKKWMSLEQHREAARTIRQAQALLNPLLADLLKTYGASSRIGKIAVHLFASGIRNGLNDLRGRLQDRFYDEGHERDGHRNPYSGRVDDGWHPIPPADEHRVWH